MKIKIDDNYYITSDSYNPAILVKFGINKENGEVVELRRWYCGRKLSAAFDEHIKQTANNDDESRPCKDMLHWLIALKRESQRC